MRLLRARGEETGSLTILPYGAVTRGCRGEEMAELGLLREAGAVAFTDGAPGHRPGAADAPRALLRRGFGRASCSTRRNPRWPMAGRPPRANSPRASACPRIPAAAEAIHGGARHPPGPLTGGAVHFAHVSTGEALDLIRAAKAEGLAVTCDTAPPYFDLNETAIGEFRTYAKLSPPLRAEADRQAVAAALADGTIDAIASDHQPRDADDKRLPFAQAAAGGAGLATLLPVTLAQVHGGALGLTRRDRPADLPTRPPARQRRPARWRGGAGRSLPVPPRARLAGGGRRAARQGAEHALRRPRRWKAASLGTWKAGRRVFG